jgi:hypothetical protein
LPSPQAEYPSAGRNVPGMKAGGEDATRRNRRRAANKGNRNGNGSGRLKAIQMVAHVILRTPQGDGAAGRRHESSFSFSALLSCSVYFPVTDDTSPPFRDRLNDPADKFDTGLLKKKL